MTIREIVALSMVIDVVGVVYGVLLYHELKDKSFLTLEARYVKRINQGAVDWPQPKKVEDEWGAIGC